FKHRSIMKKFFFVFTLLTGSMWATSQTKTTKDILLDTLCKCITAKKDELKNASPGDIQKEVMSCFMSDGLELLMKYAEEKKVSMTDQAAMQKLGNEIGMELAKKCPAMMQLAINSAIADTSEGSGISKIVSEGETTETVGTIVSLNTTEFPASIQLKQKNGTVKKAYLVSEFYTDDDNFYNTGYLPGKKVVAEISSQKIFIPSKKKFVTLDVVVKLNHQ
ncbi:MAG TPA: hypothetical protein VGQ53_23895, partial [Chitinophagaceae bacterium]|nr:hypothetical protein [Chitinophagaceae bacterium]